ncbi:MAG: OmpH family outer membrane protein [Alistipes sp.]|jgi:outer membrane protein|nr:OmpH family outer membrane protein [Alistipes sp.]
MKRVIATLVLALAFVGSTFAQKYIVVDSEKIFKSIDEYNEALATLDKLAKEYQQTVDAKYKEVESLYNAYVAQKSSLLASTRSQYEQSILAKEKAAAEYQESVFGNDGVLMKKRIELIQPIQNRVFAAIEKYAVEQGCDMVLDKASNATMLYCSPAVNHTEQIIAQLKK